MLQNLNWPPLAHCKNQLKVITMFKIMHQLIDIPTDTILIPNYSLRGHSMRLLQPNTRVDSYLNSFFPSSIKIWNNLPNDLITCSSLDQFKARLAEHHIFNFVDSLSVLVYTLCKRFCTVNNNNNNNIHALEDHYEHCYKT